MPTQTHTHRCGEEQASSQAFTLTSVFVLISQETWAPSGPTERRNYRRQTALRGQILSFLNLSTLGKTWDGVTLTGSPSCVQQTPQVSWTELQKGSLLGSARPGWILTHEVTQKQVAPTVKKRFLRNPTPTPLLHSGPWKFQLTFKCPYCLPPA